MRNRVSIVKGDITELWVDAIVNAANNTLLGGGGVDGAIHRAAGPELLEECRDLGGCDTGDAKITKGYNLPAQWVIHTVGPIWADGDQGEPELLARCYQRCFAIASQHQLKTIAFPAISAGAYGFPMGLAAEIAVKETASYLEEDASIEQVVFVCFNDRAYESYAAQLRKLGVMIDDAPRVN